MNDYLDTYAHLNSPIHRWEPRYKLIGLGGLIFAFASIQQIRLVPAMMLVSLGLYAIAQLPWSFLIRRLRYPSLFILGIVCLLPFVSGGTILWQWGALAVREEGLATFWLVLCRFWAILTLGVILLGTSPFLITVKAMRSLGFPGILADMLLLAYRYLQELSITLTTMQRAMRLRGFGHRRRWSCQRWLNLRELRLLASLAGTLFIRSYEKSQQIYHAMRLRGYGKTRAKTPGFGESATSANPPFPVWSLLSSMGISLMSLGFIVLNVMMT